MSGKQIWKAAEKVTGKAGDVNAAFLLASAQVGASPEKVRKLIGITREDARALASKARKAGLWVGRKVAGAEWFEKDGGTAFVMDCLVLEGILERVSG